MRLLIKIILLILIFSSPVYASVFYVRDGGGNYGNTSTTCNGKTNATFTGSNGPNCAVNNPAWILGIGCGNYGFGPCTINSVMASGDTLFIVGDSDINPGQQAQYPIGAGVITSSGNCSTGINCTMANPPSGGSSSSLTSIIGTGTHRPQIYGVLGVNQVLNADASYLLVNNLEITQHSACIYNFPASGTVDGFPLQCQTNSGNWAKEGIFYGGTGSEIENLWVHGIAHDGTDSDNLSNFLSYNNVISGNAFNGDAPGNIYSSGTVTFNNVAWNNEIAVYNGCGEHYPMHSSDPYDTLNYHNCYDDNNSGQGDGLGNQANSATVTGYLDFFNDDISNNTQDGLDLLHANGAGSVYIYRSRFEGNEGQQIKINNGNLYFENSTIVGDCYYFYGQSFTYMSGNPPDVCRGGGDAVRIVPGSPGVYDFYNSTLLATGPAILEYESSATCGGTINLNNDNWIGGYNTPVFGNNALATWVDDECTSGNPTVQEDYNHVWNVNGSQLTCGSSPGTHDECSNTSAGTTTTLTTSMIGPTAYYQGNDLGHLLYAVGSGNLPGNANSSLSLTGTPNDFNNYSRGSSWTIGTYQVNSCVSEGGTCFETNECCSGTCSNNVCPSSSCTSNEGSCTLGSSCCSGLCSGGSCVACVTIGNSCVLNTDCCTGYCNAGTCSVIPSVILPKVSGKTAILGRCNL